MHPFMNINQRQNRLKKFIRRKKMNIIERKDNEFIKYMIQLNEEKLKEIRQEVIEKCGEITHYSLESKREPDLNTVGVVKNFQKNFLREEDHDDFYTRWVTMFLPMGQPLSQSFLQRHLQNILVDKTQEHLRRFLVRSWMFC